MLSYTPEKNGIEKLPEAAKPVLPPERIATNEELYLTGLHLEQYRHATYESEDYYHEGLRRDGGDIRINTAYGFLLLRRGYIAECETHFRRAIERLTLKNPNPYDSEAYCGLGLSLFFQKRYDEAFDSFYKAAWTDAQQAMAFRYLALIAARRGAYVEALDFAEKALVKNGHDINTRGLKGVLLHQLGYSPTEWLRSNLALDPFDFLSRLEYGRLEPGTMGETLTLMRDNPAAFITTAIEYASAGFYAAAVETLRLCRDESPLLKYYEAEYTHLAGDETVAKAVLNEATSRNIRYCFPNRLEDISVLEYACKENPRDGYAPYLLGNLYYDKKRYDLAVTFWQKAVKEDSRNPTSHRNLALAYFNKLGDPRHARVELETAFELDKTDARIFMELDQLYKKIGQPPAERIIKYEENKGIIKERDDLYTEYISLLNLLFRHEEALELIKGHNFHPWEGGEGKITTQYTIAKTEIAKRKLKEGKAVEAVALLANALVFPDNLGEGKLAGAHDNDIYYWLGRAYENLNEKIKAVTAYEQAAAGDGELAGMMFYNDQPADLILYQGLAFRRLGREDQARSRFNKLVDYGERHVFDTLRIDYFAVSLPDMQLFEDDLDRRNRVHCHYLIFLGSLGLGDMGRAAYFIKDVLEDDPAHLGGVVHQKLIMEEYLCL
jgi:tetratricopeptide (TPR) repeat protein